MSPLRLPMLLLPAAVALLSAAAPHAAPREMRWKKFVLDTKFRAEGATVADVNRDGKNDVLAGNFWYEAPSWTPHEIRKAEEFNGATGYSNCFLTFAQDVDKDRYPDQLVVGFPGAKASWFRNPGKSGGEWTEHLITESACNESPAYGDVDGDGVPDLVTPFKETQMAYYTPGKTPLEGFEQHLIGEPKQPGCARFSHGLGIGDINGDRRPDILTTDGYYQAPEDRKAGKWQFVPAKLGDACGQMYTLDLDGDGDMDVVSSSAHNIGVWWHEQVKGAAGPEFVRHDIDKSFSQSHSMMMADINGDGQPDFVTGKRFWAHGPNGDVNPSDPAVLYWFEFHRKDGKVEWSRHEIDNDSGVGTQFTVARIDGDKRPDVAIGNKKGVFVFLQEKD
ncbi:MAG: distantly related to retaining beta-L-arabinofuranosidase from Bifidobacterium longum [Armatimonadetes bacterium]|nr:distantly related to retaining beta-L-arabinofuranosidase from Bifidobacterium longum [Armatimonadota bacterium]